MVADLVLVLHVTLDEMYHGCTKEKSFMRKVYRNGHRFTILDKVTVHVLPGCPDHTFVRFVGRGEEFCRTDLFGTEKVECGDVVIQIVQVPPPPSSSSSNSQQQQQQQYFSRLSGNEQHHLWYVPGAEFTLKNALCGVDRTVTVENHPAQHIPTGSMSLIQKLKATLPRTKPDFTVRIDDNIVLYDGYILMAKGLGMPVYGNSDQHGDLFIQIRIRFPDQLSNDAKNHIRHVLEEHDNVDDDGNDSERNESEEKQQEMKEEKGHSVASSLYDHAASSNVKYIRQKLSNMLRK